MKGRQNHGSEPVVVEKTETEAAPNLRPETWMQKYPHAGKRTHQWFWALVLGFGAIIGFIWFISLAFQVRGLTARQANERDLIDKTKESWQNAFEDNKAKTSAYAIEQQLRMVIASMTERAASSSESGATTTLPNESVTTTP